MKHLLNDWRGRYILKNNSLLSSEVGSEWSLWIAACSLTGSNDSFSFQGKADRLLLTKQGVGDMTSTFIAGSGMGLCGPNFFNFTWFFQEKMSKYWVSSYIPVSSHDLENMDLVHAINGYSKSFVKMSCTTFWKTTLIRWIEKQRNHRFLKILGSKRFWQIIDLLNLMHKWNCRKIDFKPCWLKPYS